ncbi:MAG: Hsp20/alpha crystallin family protein [Candidatus Gracilibacteria bacterium]|nr:Hsp20/alpha crystallin family protein [Candidatus Gracilibacteria bacterium]
MFKLFGVKDEENELDVNEEVELEYGEDEEFTEEDMGQVSVDILVGKDEIIVVAPIAGIDLDGIDITLEKTIMTIKGTRKKPEVYDIEDIELKNSECYFGKFVRNIILPENLALNKIKAIMEDNMLIIKIPKLKFNSKSIKIDRIEG